MPLPSYLYPRPHHPLFTGSGLVRLGLEARGPSAAAREGERGTKMKGGGGAEILYWENPSFIIS